MESSDTRSVEPLGATFGLTLTADDLTKAFINQADPDEQLSYDLFVRFRKLKVSEQLTVLSKVAQLVETASTLDGTLAGPVPKDAQP